MPAPRKIFRIEETPNAWLTQADAAEPPPGGVRRIAHELEAVTDGTAQATQRILAAAEQIDHMARKLAAALGDQAEAALAHDICDLAVSLFEMCNFQDLAGQRVSKVLTALEVGPRRDAGSRKPLAAAAQAGTPDIGARCLHGPRLDGDSGHVSQTDVDAIFGG